ncbi:MAG: hypothetical protein CL610_11125 [Anaerolineaceae bacterium]|nr:hypothetical protein [Anaerolineaceae bacterium]
MAKDDILGKDVLAVVGHELKAPISAVQGFIELIQQGDNLTAAQVRYCGRALAGLERMENLIEALLELARLEQGADLTFEDCDLRELVHNALDMVEAAAEERQVDLVVQVDDDLGIVSGERRLLGLVINNLLVNAIKYNQKQGTVWVSATNQPDFVRVDVRDSGVGIPEDDQPHVFEQFFRASNSAETRASGSGLGLAIARLIVQKHEGYIWLKSALGEGSTFSFTIPRQNHASDGADPFMSDLHSAGEGNDMRHRQQDEFSIEEADDIDDNTQESNGSRETDSSSDVV